MTSSNTTTIIGDNAVLNRAIRSSRRHNTVCINEHAFWRNIERDLKKAQRLSINSAK